MEISKDVKILKAFLLFCLLSGSVYIINDIFDREKDRDHPLKSQRPISSGRIAVEKAIVIAIVFSLLALIVSFLLDRYFGLVALGYFLLNLGYSWRLKDVVIIDVMVVALGFVLRVVAGGVIIRVEISAWILVCTTLLALFLVLSKRRYELVSLNKRAESHRSTLAQYSPYFLDQMIGVVTASTLMSYALYTI
ncbi:MAG: UbiA family prenyltransferase, partial [Deltaproteobacteria bacterium]